MKVYKEENPEGVIQSITFRDENEPPSDFKNGVKSWLRDNYPGMSWEEFVNRLTLLEAGRITISML